MARSKPKALLTDIGVTIVVFMVAVIMLGITNYRNNQIGNDLTYRVINPDGASVGLELADTILLLHSQNEVRQFFPNFSEPVDYDTQALLAYIAPPQPTAGYRLQLQTAHRQGPVATLRYQLQPPPAGSFNATVITQPVLFVVLQRDELISSGQFTIRLQNTDTNQTSSLSVFSDEI